MSDMKITTPGDLSILKKTATPDPKKMANLQGDKLKKVAQDFEAMFMDMVMQKMREGSVFESDVEGDSQHVKFFQQMLDTEYSKQAGTSSKIGIADTMIRQLTRAQINGENVK